MNKKIAVSLGLIAVLALALFVLTREKGRDLPQTAPWKGQTEEMTIKRPGDTVRLFREGESWFIGEEKYPADPKAVAELEDKMKKLSLSDLISERGHYDRFDLGEDRAIEVSVRAAGKEVRRVFIGKKSGTYRHTYVRLADNPAVYLAEGQLSGGFVKPIDDLRNREIFSISKSDIQSVEIRHGASLVTLNKKGGPKAASKDEKADKDGEAPKEERWECRQCAGTVDETKIKQIVGSFAPFNAAAFPPIEKDTLGPARCKVLLTAESKNIEIAFYSKIDDNRYFCTSSESPYVFAVDTWKAERYFVTPDDLKEKK